jgi:sugar lactone lactonase YvrE
MVEIAADRLELLAQGLAFPEGPRWRADALWFSDIHAGRVLRLGEGAAPVAVAEGLDRPSGLGWLTDGQLLIVEGGARRLLRHDGDALAVHADLAALAEQCCNDMVVGPDGRAWVGNWGFDFIGGEAPRPASLVAVDPDGRARVAAVDLRFPNGSAITPDGRTLLVAETFAARVSAFDIGADGVLSNCRTWARLAPDTADGIALDAEGALWVASPTTRSVIRVRAGGTVTHRVALPEHALAVALGGADRRTLFVACAHLFDETASGRRFVTPARSRALASGKLRRLRVDVPGAGWP